MCRNTYEDVHKMKNLIALLTLFVVVPVVAQVVNTDTCVVDGNGWKSVVPEKMEKPVSKKFYSPDNDNTLNNSNSGISLHKTVYKEHVVRDEQVGAREIPSGNNYTNSDGVANGMNGIFGSYSIHNINGSPLDINVLSFGYMHSMKFCGTRRSFLQVGGMLSYSWAERDVDYYQNVNCKLTMISLEVPVDVMYRLPFADGSCALEPYVGFSFAGYLYGDLKTDMTSSINVFDKDVEGYLSRFMFRARAGLNISFGHVYFGGEYSHDINKFCVDINRRSYFFTARLGCRF